MIINKLVVFSAITFTVNGYAQHMNSKESSDELSNIHINTQDMQDLFLYKSINSEAITQEIPIPNVNSHYSVESRRMKHIGNVYCYHDIYNKHPFQPHSLLKAEHYHCNNLNGYTLKLTISEFNKLKPFGKINNNNYSFNKIFAKIWNYKFTRNIHEYDEKYEGNLEVKINISDSSLKNNEFEFSGFSSYYSDDSKTKHQRELVFTLTKSENKIPIIKNMICDISIE